MLFLSFYHSGILLTRFRVTEKQSRKVEEAQVVVTITMMISLLFIVLVISLFNAHNLC